LSKYGLITALLLLYLTSLGGVGFLLPDEPRYASIGREMAHSGDWITPRLDGQGWFEKPPLIYWTTAAGNWLGFSDEWAARLPVALISLAFLIFFYRTMEREFSARVGLMATAILGTSAGWAAVSFAAVPDLPLAACFNAAMMIALFGPKALSMREKGFAAQGYMAGVMLGLAILAKAFVPIVLIFPVFLIARGKRLPMLIGAVLVAAPWHILCYWKNGSVFWDDYFWKQQVARVYSSSLEHGQPFYYYIPVLLGGLFPWTPLVALLGRRRSYDDERVRFLLVNLLYGLVFFSVVRNKLPAYILPLLPGVAIVLAVAVDRARNVTWWIAGCTALLAAVPVIANILPDAMSTGLTHVTFHFALGWPFLIAAAAVGWLGWSGEEGTGHREWAVLMTAITAVAAILYLKSAAFPALDRQVSVRQFWRANSQAISGACEDRLPRDWEYGLNYYAAKAVPQCSGDESVRIVSADGKLALSRR
jgi:4-amino-4-deoxy-L-arabinose transferase-like glycosyltransferase